jgi:hypothetical protein
MYAWKFQKLREENDFKEDILEAIHQVFLDGFGLEEGWSLESIRKVLKHSTILGLLVTDSNEIVGYAFGLLMGRLRYLP